MNIRNPNNKIISLNIIKGKKKFKNREMKINNVKPYKISKFSINIFVFFLKIIFLKKKEYPNKTKSIKQFTENANNIYFLDFLIDISFKKYL